MVPSCVPGESLPCARGPGIITSVRLVGRQLERDDDSPDPRFDHSPNPRTSDDSWVAEREHPYPSKAHPSSSSPIPLHPYPSAQGAVNERAMSPPLEQQQQQPHPFLHPQMRTADMPAPSHPLGDASYDPLPEPGYGIAGRGRAPNVSNLYTNLMEGSDDLSGTTVGSMTYDIAPSDLR